MEKEKIHLLKPISRIDILKCLHAACIEDRRIKQEIQAGTFKPTLVLTTTCKTGHGYKEKNKYHEQMKEWTIAGNHRFTLSKQVGDKVITIVIQRNEERRYIRYRVIDDVADMYQTFNNKAEARKNYGHLLVI